MRRGAISCVALLSLVAAGFPTWGRTETAAEMVSDCAPYRHALQLAPRTAGSELVEAPGGNGKSNFCWGAFATLQSLTTLQAAGALDFHLTGRLATQMCVPAGAQRLQLVKVFLQHMDKHHEEGNLDFGIALVDALLDAFPCPPVNR